MRCQWCIQICVGPIVREIGQIPVSAKKKIDSLLLLRIGQELIFKYKNIF